MAGIEPAPTCWILHLGLGSFHRAHQAVFLHHLQQQQQQQQQLEWALASGTIRDDMRETMAALVASGGAYTLETVSPQGERTYERITSIRRVLPFHPNAKPLAEQARDPQTRIISFTVTEAGYTSDLSSEIAQFSQPPPPAGYAPTTLYGALAVLLEARRVVGAGKVTLLCCDNLRNNGERSRAGLLDFLRKTGADDLCAWVEANTTSPSTMVDRITPRPTAAVRERVRAATGTDDPAALMAESFIQWVVEDNFCSGRPAWEAVGAQLVPDVHPFEEAKIRILNATHSLVAWAGTLLGLEFIHEDVQTPAIRDFAVDYINNSVIPLLTPSPLDLAAYRDSVLERFASPHVKDSNARVAMDGFAKTTGFIAPTLRQHLAKGAKAADPALGGVALLPAFFLAYLQVWHRNELPHKYDDAAMDPAVGHAICADADPVAALSGCAALWDDLAGNDVLTEAIRIAYMRVHEFQAQNSN